MVERPKAKRLRAGKAHRTALLESLPEEQRPIAEQVVLGGLPAVPQAIEKQNAERTAAGEPAIAAGPLLEMAEKLVPKVRAAEWRDRAEAAQRDLEVLESVTLSLITERRTSQPWGLAGGQPGAVGENWLLPGGDEGRAERLPDKCTVHLAAGDVVRMRTPGGGGWGAGGR